MEENNEILVKYLDGNLNTEEINEVNTRLENDAALASHLLYLKIAIDTVKRDAIVTKVAAISQSYKLGQSAPAKPAAAMVRSLYKNSLRVAAILILFAGLTVVYKYMSVDSKSIYSKQFFGYDLTNTRGISTSDAEVVAYQNKKWNDVTRINASEMNKTNKSQFLAAMAEMELGHFPKAVALFENILQAGDHSFHEESEYFLSLAYLMNHQATKSVSMLEKIKANTSHTYYPLASKISSIDLQIITLKK